MAPNQCARIAVIDDSVLLCDMLSELLTDEGYQVITYALGKDALDKLNATRPDLILLDINLPDISGYEVCRRLKKDPNLKEIPVVFISNYSELDEKIAAFECGGVDYVTKPIQMAEVSARIKTHLNLRHYQHELEQKNTDLENTLSDLKTTQVQLLQSEKMASLGQLVAGVAHEINNPISFIYGNSHALNRYIERLQRYLAAIHNKEAADKLEMLRSSLNIDHIFEELTPLVGDIHEATQRVSDIVDDLRSFSSRETADKEQIELCKISTIASRWISKSQDIEPIITTELPTELIALGNAGQITQVLINLMSNGLDAAGDQARPELRISGGYEGNQTWLAVEDNGNGIEPDAMPKIFDPFFTTKPVGQGTGLGLSICYTILKEHGGDLIASNTEQGAKFCIKLPRATNKAD